jgi:hypothetical protein
MISNDTSCPNGLGAPLLGASDYNLAIIENAIAHKEPTSDRTAPLNISGVKITGTNPASFSQTNNCGSTLAPGANCVLSIVFSRLALEH